MVTVLAPPALHAHTAAANAAHGIEVLGSLRSLILRLSSYQRRTRPTSTCTKPEAG